jgi:hypothetical protein
MSPRTIALALSAVVRSGSPVSNICELRGGAPAIEV